MKLCKLLRLGYKIMVFLCLVVIAFPCCDPDGTNESLVPVPELIGFSQFGDYGANNVRNYNAVPSDDDLMEMEKSQMLEFREDGSFRQFFWNWCATPPMTPSEWQSGTWELISESPQTIELTWDQNPSFIQAFEILDLTETSLSFRGQN